MLFRLTFAPHNQQPSLVETVFQFPEDSKDNSSTDSVGVGRGGSLLSACCQRFSFQMDDRDHSIVECNSQCLQDNCYIQILGNEGLSFFQVNHG